MNKFLGKHGDAIFFMAIGALFATGISYFISGSGTDILNSLSNKHKDMNELKKRARAKAIKDREDVQSTVKENTLKSKLIVHNEGVSIPTPYIQTPRNQMIDKGGIYPGSLDDLDVNDFPYGSNYGYYYLDKKNREELATHLSFAAQKKPYKIGTGTYQHTSSNPMIDSNQVYSIIGDKY
jgi:hypothetical protein